MIWMCMKERSSRQNRKDYNNLKRSKKSNHFVREQWKNNANSNAKYTSTYSVIKASNESSFDNFLAIVDCIWKLFTCFMKGHEVFIMQDDAAIMMKISVMKEMTDLLSQASEKWLKSSVDEWAKKKQQQGTQAVHTEKEAHDITTLHQETKRDEFQNQITTKMIDTSNMKWSNLETILAALTTCKNTLCSCTGLSINQLLRQTSACFVHVFTWLWSVHKVSRMSSGKLLKSMFSTFCQKLLSTLHGLCYFARAAARGRETV